MNIEVSNKIIPKSKAKSSICLESKRSLTKDEEYDNTIQKDFERLFEEEDEIFSVFQKEIGNEEEKKKSFSNENTIESFIGIKNNNYFFFKF